MSKKFLITSENGKKIFKWTIIIIWVNLIVEKKFEEFAEKLDKMSTEELSRKYSKN